MAVSFEYRKDLTCAMAVSDMEASIKWFEEMLGFELMYKDEEIMWCEMTTPLAGVTVGFSQVESPEVKGGATLVFGVADIETAHQELSGKGVRFDGEIQTIPGLVKLATFFDRDGHKFMFSQSLMSGSCEPETAGAAR